METGENSGVLPWRWASGCGCHLSSALERQQEASGALPGDPRDVGWKHSIAMTLEGHSPEYESNALTAALSFHNWKTEIVTSCEDNVCNTQHTTGHIVVD